MPTEYQYSAPPQPLKPTKKYRAEDEGVPLNMLSDPRVVKGNTHALARQMAITKESLPTSKLSKTGTQKPAAETAGKADSSIPSMPSYEFVVRGFVGPDMSLDAYLVEQEYVPTVSEEVETQTDAFVPRPQTPDFIPRKTGIDVHTQVEDVNELFNFDEEVKPLVAVIVDKTIEQALFEVKAEMELLSLEEDAAVFHRQKAAEEEWIRQKLQETRNDAENKAKAVKLQQEEINKQIRLKTLVAGLQCVHQLMPAMLDDIEADLYNSNRWTRDNIVDIKRNFLDPSIERAGRALVALDAAKDLLDEMLLEAQDKYVNWKAARQPPPRHTDLIVTIRGSGLTFAAPETAVGEDGEAVEPVEVAAKDLVVNICVGEADSIVDINRMIREKVQQANATPNAPISVLPYFTALLGSVLSDVPLLNFSLPARLQIVI